MQPLEGIRVIDLTNVLSGPFCCHQLAHMGAEVIKVEVPGRGDLARQLGADPDLNARNMGVSFLAQNAGKKSVTLNLKHETGRELLKALVRTADVLVENYRPGVMERLGLSWQVLREENPRLIYCAISGFGQEGPWVQRPAYDQIIQGMAGVMSVTGEKNGAPLRVGYPLADTIGGMTAAFAISAALNGRDKKGGVFIDVSMLEATLATMGWVVSNWLIAGVEPQANGNENVTSAPSGAFQCADGLLNIAANKDEQWRTMAKLLDREDLLGDPAYATREDRKKNRFQLKAELEKTFCKRGAGEWETELNEAGVPAGVVLTVPQVLETPQVADRNFLATFDKVPGVGRVIKVARVGVKMNGEVPKVGTPPPELGQDNDKIYGALGLSTGEIADLRKEGVI